MSLKKLFLILFSFLSVLILVLVSLILTLFSNQATLTQSEEIRYLSYLRADELRQSSDDLTRMARTYVVTGDPFYEEIYWQILDIRNGLKPRPQRYEGIYWDYIAAGLEPPRPEAETIALQEIMEQLGFTEDEFALLRTAQANSDALVRTEEIAMDAIKGNISELDRERMLPGESNNAFARRIMHDADYHREKAKIMEPIDQFLEKLDQRTSQTVAYYQQKQQLLLWIILAVTALILAGNFGAYYIIHMRVARPMSELQQVTRRIGEGDLTQSVGFQSKDEIGDVARALNLTIGQLLAIINQLRGSSDMLSKSGSQLQDQATESSQTMQQLSEQIDREVKQAENSSRGISELNDGLEQVADGVQRVASVANTISEASELMISEARKGRSAVERLATQMQSIHSGSSRTSGVVDELNQAAAEIESIVQMIDSISSQTNLLALNAAIEAARAGDAGRGFAVVADEIGKLAIESTQSTSRIAALIGEIQSKTANAVQSALYSRKDLDEGLAVIEETGSLFRRILEAIDTITHEIQEMTAGSEEMSASTEEISATSSEIARTALETATQLRQATEKIQGQQHNSQRLADSARELSQIADELQSLMQQFKLT